MCYHALWIWPFIEGGCEHLLPAEILLSRIGNKKVDSRADGTLMVTKWTSGTGTCALTGQAMNTWKSTDCVARSTKVMTPAHYSS